MPADLLRRSWRLAILACLGAAVPLWLGGRAAPPPADYFQHDQRHYLAMADAGTPPSPAARTAPYSWRLLPSALVRWSGLPPGTGFHALTLVTLALIPPAAAVMLTAAGVSTISALTMGAAIALAPAVAGYLSWDFIRPDGPSLLLVIVSAWAAIRARPVAFIATLVALSLTKETWLIGAGFALVWSRAYRPAFWRWAVAGAALAFAGAAAVRVALPAVEPYSVATIVRDLYWPIDLRTVARRLLLATAGTWNVLTPLAAFAVARRCREPRAHAVALAIGIASAQILVAIDTQRLVAAAYPFVVLACAWELDRLPHPARAAAGVLLALAQVPWLVTYARVRPLPLRSVEIALVVMALAAAAWGFRAGRAQPPAARSLTM